MWRFVSRGCLFQCTIVLMQNPPPPKKTQLCLILSGAIDKTLNLSTMGHLGGGGGVGVDGGERMEIVVCAGICLSACYTSLCASATK